MKKTPAFFLRAGLFAFLLLAAAGPASAAVKNCGAQADNLIFGTINLLAGGVTDSSSTINYWCNADPGTRVLLCIGMEQDPRSGVFSPRTITQTNRPDVHMEFNVYSDAARSIIWGSLMAGGGYEPVPIIMSFGAGEYHQTGSTALYGRINSAGQAGLPAGYYNTNTFGGGPLSISYKTLATNETADCSTATIKRPKESSFYIEAIVRSDCRIDSTTTMDFGTVFMELNANVDSVATITITCNGGQSGNGYRVYLGNGLYATGNQRRMRGTPGFIRYELYRDPQRSSRWGTDWNDAVTGVGTGLPQSLTVYGRVPPQSPPGAARYSDTIIITLSY